MDTPPTHAQWMDLLQGKMVAAGVNTMPTHFAKEADRRLSSRHQDETLENAYEALKWYE